MGLEYNSGYCKECEAVKKLQRNTPNHLLHFIIVIALGIVSFGIGSIIWLFVWIGISIQFGGWRCSTCGSKDVKASFQMPSFFTSFLIFSALAIFLIIPYLQDEFKNRPNMKKEVKKENVKQGSQAEYDAYEVNQVKQELVKIALSDELKSVTTASWNSNTFTLIAKRGVDNLDGFSDYICSNYMNSGRYDSAYNNGKIVYIKVKNSYGLTIDKHDCFKE